MDLNRVQNFHKIVEAHAEKGTREDKRVRAGTHNGKIQLDIVSTTGEAFGASRKVKQLAHTLSQLNKHKDDKISYDGKVLKDFFTEHVGEGFTKHLDKEGIFKDKMTFGKLQTISAALKKTADGPQEQAQPQATVGEDKSAEPVTQKNKVQTVWNKISPRKLAQKNWVKKQAGGEKVDGANLLLGETSKSFLSGQRGVQFYNDLSEEDKATLKTLIDSKHNDLQKDGRAVDAKQDEFIENSKTVNQIQAEHQKRLEDHAKTFPDLMRFYDAAKEDKNYPTLEGPRKACIDKLVDIKILIRDLKVEHSDLEFQDKKRMNDWIAGVQKLLNAWEATNYTTLDPKKLGFVDQFCDSAKKSFAEYKGLALENTTVKNIEKQKFAKLEAIEEEPMDRLLQDTSLSDAAKSFLLKELARFTHDNADLKGFEKYQNFINHLILLEASGGVSLDLPSGIDLPPIEGHHPIEDYLKNVGAELDAFAAADAQKKKPITNEPPQPLSAKKVRKKTKAQAGGNKGILPYEKVVANLLAKPKNRHDLKLSLMAYAKQKNSALQLISAKLFGDGSGGKDGILNIYAKDPKFSLAFEPVKRVIEEEIDPSLFNQSLSLQEMETIDRRITEYVALKEKGLFTDLKFKGQDEDLKNLLARKIKQLSPKQKGSEELAQKMIADWYEYKEQKGVQSLITETQINGFLNYLSDKYKA